LVSPLWLLYRVQVLVVGESVSFSGYSQLMSLFPGITGNYLRFAFYRLTLAELGADACICFGVTMADPRTRIGRGTYLGSFCNLGLCTIENDVLLGTGVHIISGFGQHGHTRLDTPMRDQPGKLLNVRIGNDTWIGNGAIVGNHVGSKCIIGAAALVSRAIPDFSVAVGNPARVIRDRRELADPGTESTE
jgi:acetyltransferase-like isoleucine patch superfamily enzyme